jgi:hypothetical protein
MQAWLHFHTGLMLVSQPFGMMDDSENTHNAAFRHFCLVEQCLNRADEAIVAAARVAKIKEHEVCGTSGLAFLFISSLTVDKLDEGKGVINHYRESLDQLVCESFLMTSRRLVLTIFPNRRWL